MEITRNTKRQERSSSKVKNEDNACVFLLQQGNYSLRVCPWVSNCHWKFLLECSGTPMEEDSPYPARVLSTRQLVFFSRQCTGSPGSCCTIIFSLKQVWVLCHQPYSPDLSPCDYFLFSWSYHWKCACLKMFKTCKQFWYRVFGPYHKKTCRGPSSLC